MSSILLFLAPPVVGAFIGFITNVIAIKMLFRPLEEIRIFGIRVPFTPGVLPKQRHKLAINIGVMVEKELLTPELLRQRLEREEVRQKIKHSLSLFTEKILSANAGDLLPQNRKNFIHEKIMNEAEKNYPFAAEAFLFFLRSENVRRHLEARGQVFLSSVILKLNVFQRLFISAAQYDLTLSKRMPEIIDDFILNIENILKDESVKQKLFSTAGAVLEQFLGNQNKNIGSIINLNVDEKEKLDNFLFEQLQAVLDGQIENMLTSINVQDMVRERIDSLDMLRVEKIVFDVMANQFKWINIFGGILGFLIGLFQVFLITMLR